MFQSIYDILDKYLYDGWQKLVVSCEYADDCFSVTFYEKIDNIYYSCFDIDDIDKKNLFEDFDLIDELILTERENLSEKWTLMTIEIDSEGNMNADFEYEDIMTDIQKHRTEWKKKYLI